MLASDNVTYQMKKNGILLTDASRHEKASNETGKTMS